MEQISAILDSNKEDKFKNISFGISFEHEYKNIYDSKNINISEINSIIVFLNKFSGEIIYLFKGAESSYMNRPSILEVNNKYYSHLDINEHLDKISSTNYKDFLIYLMNLGVFEVNSNINMIINDNNIVFPEDKNIFKIVKSIFHDFLHGLNKEEKTISILLMNLYINMIFDLHYKFTRIKDNTEDINEKKINNIYRKSIFNYLEINFQTFNDLYDSNDIFDIQKSIFFKDVNYAFKEDFPYIETEQELNYENKINNFEIIETISKLSGPIFNFIEQRNNKIKNSKNLIQSHLYRLDKILKIVDKKYDFEYLYHNNNSSFKPIDNVDDYLNKLLNREETNFEKSISLESNKENIDDYDETTKENINIIKRTTNVAIFNHEVNRNNNYHKGALDDKINSMVGKKQDLIYINNRDYINTIKNKLDDKFPWMKELNKTIIKSLIFNFKNEKHIALKNIILEGKPGIGKSYYMATLAELLDLPYVNYKAGGRTEFLDFTGNSSNWGGSNPSLMTKMVLNHNVLNPLILVDELDKASNNNNGDLQNSLLSLIDKNEAKNYFDPYLSYNVDFSKFNWMFTINDKSLINKYLLDRSKVIKIEEPKEEHFNLIFDNILRDFCFEEGINIDDILKINIPRKALYEEFKMNYSLRKTKDSIIDYIDNHYYNEFFGKPNLNVIQG